MAHEHSGARRYLRGWSQFSAIFFVVALVFLLLNWTSSYGDTSKWKIFSNQAGWTIKYPANWKIASCHSCSDPTEPDVFVFFFPPGDTSSGGVMITPLEDKPSSMNLDAWFNDIKKRANPHPQISAQRLTLGELPALKVRYRNPSDGGREMEDVYVVSDSQAYSLSFGGEKPGLALEKYESYSIYIEMVRSFRVKR